MSFQHPLYLNTIHGKIFYYQKCIKLISFNLLDNPLSLVDQLFEFEEKNNSRHRIITAITVYGVFMGKILGRALYT